MFGFMRRLMGPKTNFKSLQQAGAIILDVRTPAEYQQGHIPGSLNVAINQVSLAVADLKKQNKPVITCCRSGARSAAAAGILKNAGIEVYNGGAWNELLNQL